MSPDGSDGAAERTLEAVARRLDAAARLEPPAGAAVLQSIVEAIPGLLGAEAASLALHDAARDRLRFVVAAGSQGGGVVGLEIGTQDGIAGYVFSTGQPLAISDTATDPRFDRSAAERTGFVPRSLLAVPLADDEGTLGVLEVLDRRGTEPFTMRDIELASVFARQAAIAIRATRLERDGAGLLRDALLAVVAASDEAGALDAATIDRLVTAAADETATATDDPIWRLADRLARLRAVDSDMVELAIDWLDAMLRRAGGAGGGNGATRTDSPDDTLA